MLKLIGDVIPDKAGWRLVKKIVEKLTELSEDKIETLELMINAELKEK